MNSEDDFLFELNNCNFTEDIQTKNTKEENKQLKADEILIKKLEKARIKQAKEQEKEDMKNQKLLNKANKNINKDDNYNLIQEDDKPTEIIGDEKRKLLNKISQYKYLFPNELKSFKLKKNPTILDLKEVIDEMDSIINTDTVESFLMDGIMTSLKLIEGLSAISKNYNVTGLSDLLKLNPSFIKLSKQLFIKYNCFSNTPPEYQMLMIISTTAYICKSKNSKKDEIERLLNEPINI